MQQMTKNVFELIENHEGFSEVDDALKTELVEMIAKISESDPLTNVANRIKIVGMVETEWSRSIRYHSPISIIMFDIDGFKNINDTYGHDVGDEVLKTIANLIDENIRTTDTIGRWGDDEFMILVPTTNNEQASWLAQKLSKTISGTLFQGVGKITCSFGIADREAAMDVEDWLQIVELALDASKADAQTDVVDYEMIARRDL